MPELASNHSGRTRGSSIESRALRSSDLGRLILATLALFIGHSPTNCIANQRRQKLCYRYKTELVDVGSLEIALGMHHVEILSVGGAQCRHSGNNGGTRVEQRVLAIPPAHTLIVPYARPDRVKSIQPLRLEQGRPITLPPKVQVPDTLLSWNCGSEEHRVCSRDSPFVKFKDYGLTLDLGGAMCAPPKAEVINGLLTRWQQVRGAR